LKQDFKQPLVAINVSKTGGFRNRSNAKEMIAIILLIVLKYISRGGFNNSTLGTIKRKFEELESVCSLNPISITEIKEGSVPLAFYKEEIPGGSPNYQIPLLVKARMANFDVRRILVDQGSSCDIMYFGLFKTLQLTEKNLSPYVGADLQGFNGATTKPWGYTDLIVTFGEE
jgi:hypothetical protein